MLARFYSCCDKCHNQSNLGEERAYFRSQSITGYVRAETQTEVRSMNNGKPLRAGGLDPRLVLIQCSYTVQDHLPRAWCRPQWAGPRDMKEQSRQLLWMLPPFGGKGKEISVSWRPARLHSEILSLAQKQSGQPHPR